MNFYNFCNFNSNITLQSKFNYNFYEKNETLTNDNEVAKSNDYNSKEIEVLISYKSGYDKSNAFLEKYVESLNLEYLKSLNNTSLDRQQISFINNLREKNYYLKKNINLDENKIRNYNNTFNINIENFGESFRKNILDSKKLYINRDKINFFEEKNKNNIFFNDKTLEDSNDYYENNDAIRKNVKDKSNFLDSMLSYNEKTIFSDTSVYFYHVGVLVLKYKKVNDSYKVIANKFFLNNRINDKQYRSSSNYSFKDNAIKYGDVYKYAVYPVFNISVPKYKDFHILQDILYCDIPSFTKDISCKENTRPLPPANIDFKYLKNKEKLLISWKPEADSVGDQKGYQIFKRYSLDEPFKLVKQIEYHLETDLYEKNSLIPSTQIEKRKEDFPLEFYDTLEKEKINIYALCTIDAHGYVSNYSTQIGVKYNYFTKGLEIDLVSSPGAPLFYPNLFIKRKTKFFDNDDKIVTITPYVQNINKICLYATPDFAIINNNSDSSNNNLLYKENYKFNIFKVENNENYIDDIKIKNFNLD